jgi:plastocyanin
MKRTSNMTRRLALTTAVTALAFTFAACGSDDDSSATTDAPAAAEDTVVADTTAVADTAVADTTADAAVIEIEAVDYAFENLPASVPAGTKLALTNNSQAELHELVAIRLPDDETRPVDELVQLPEAEIGALLGSAPPATVLLAAPGGEQIAAVGDGTLTEPGRYIVICAIPSGADPAAYLEAAAASAEGPPEVEGGPPHFVHGMFAELTVE